MSKNSIISVSVLGAGNMGTALANIIANNGFVVKLWNYEGDITPLQQIEKNRENKKYLPGVKLSHNIKIEKNLSDAVSNSAIIFFVVPSKFVGELTKNVALYINKKTICVHSCKGLDKDSLLTVSKIISEHLPIQNRKNIGVISGPAVAKDMVKNHFTAMNLSGSKSVIKLTKQVLENDNLRLIKNDDTIGVEIAGSLKNVYAIAIGLCDCYGFPMNTKAAIFVSAIKEMAALIKKMGGKEKTIFDLAGLGDLIGTAMSEGSRNRRFGACLPNYSNKDKAMESIGQAVEGVETSKTILSLAKKYKTPMPLAQTIYDIIWKGADANLALKKFLKKIS